MVQLAIGRSGALVLTVVLIQSCGGGGGGDGGNGPQAPSVITLSSESFTATATPGDLPPDGLITLDVSNPPPGLTVQADYSDQGLHLLNFEESSGGGRIVFTFRSPGSLPNGTYVDDVVLKVCSDSACRTQIDGSPRTIQISYVVSGDGPVTAQFDRESIDVRADQRDQRMPETFTTLTLNTLPPSGVLMRVTETSPAIRSAASIHRELVRDLWVTFRAPNEMATGQHDDVITVELCYDESCVRQVKGSPFMIATHYLVTLGIEPGLSSLQTLRREPLGHDVIDAEFSAALNAIVMVSGQPDNALYRYDVAAGTQAKQPLALLPTAVSVAPNGLVAAVGHDSHVSVVTLADVGNDGAPAPELLDVADPVSDLAIDDTGHVFTTHAESERLHSIDIATRVDTPTFARAYRLKLVPHLSRLYGTLNLSPSSLMAIDISAGLAGFPLEWGYTGSHRTCLKLWTSTAGDRIYTACGETYATRADPAQDMTYAGSMVLTAPPDWPDNRIRSASHDPAAREVAVIESNFIDCNPLRSAAPCYTRFEVYDDQFLERQAIYGIGPMTIDGRGYAHLGRFVFHDADGRELLIGEVVNPPEPAQQFWLSVIP